MKDFIIYFLANTGSSAIISHLMKFRDIINILGFEPFDQHNLIILTDRTFAFITNSVDLIVFVYL